MLEFMPLILFAAICGVLMFGFPVALSLAGTALLFAGMGLGLEAMGIDANFDSGYLAALPNRLYGIMTNQTLLAVPLFVLMGVLLEKSKVAETLLDAMALLFGSMRGGLGISVTLVGMLMAASTGIVGATVVTMGLMSLPTMLKRGYSTSLATGTICATGTLGQIIPPSIALVLLGDVLSSAYQQAQLDMGIFSPKTVSVGDLFMGALVPGLLLVVMYMVYVGVVAWLRPHMAPAADREELMAELVSAQEVVEGQHYELLESPVETHVEDGQIGVTEVFWFGCPHCYRLQTPVNEWYETLEDDVSVEHMPATMGGDWNTHATAFYAAESLGIEDELHADFFNAIHQEKQSLTEPDEIAAFFSNYGVSEEEAKQALTAFSVRSEVNEANNRMREMKLMGVPALVIDGRYVVTPSSAGSLENMPQVAAALVEQVRAERAE